jgi:hypothetical protein
MTLFAIKARVDDIILTYEKLQEDYTQQALQPIAALMADLMDGITPSPTYWDIDDIMTAIEEAIAKLKENTNIPKYVGIWTAA